MVWFQCEDCGENLKKPKLPNHFRICSAYKLSCIDCGEIFSKDSVQNHTQCMTEAEKYGPKDHGKPLQNSNSKPEKPKKNADVDINVGLSSHPPWFCRLCNTSTTSKQTLLQHADGKKHRAKAKACLAAQRQSNQTVETKDNNKENVISSPKLEKAVEPTGLNADQLPMANDTAVVGPQQVLEKKFEKKRKHEEVGSIYVSSNACDSNNEEGIKAEEKGQSTKNMNAEKLTHSECIGNEADNGLVSKKKIKWKKFVISTLKSNPDSGMKIKKLRKLVVKELKASGIPGDEVQLCDAMMEKISSSCRFVINKKLICLAEKTKK